MSYRWSPPGDGWLRVIDCGNLAAWMRPEHDGLSIAVYTGDGFGHLADTDRAETWIVRVPSSSVIPYQVMDKPHRIRWVLTSEYPEYSAMSVEREQVPRSHAGHRRLNANRRIWEWPLPDKILRCLDN